MTPSRQISHRSFRKLVGPANASFLWGADLHIGAANISMDPPPPGLDSDKGDLISFFQTQWNKTPPYQTEYASIDYNKLNFTMRNQGNFGFYLKVYIIRTPQAFSADSLETINEMISTLGWQNYADTWTSNNDLTEIPGISRYIKIVRRYQTQMLPGETKKFHLRTPRMPNINLGNHTFRLRNKWTRSILFQFTGFPLHNVENELQIASAPCVVDTQMMWRIKGRVLHNTPNTAAISADDSTTSNLGGQQIQTGIPDTLFDA